MLRFTCPTCEQIVFFDSQQCAGCATALGFDRATRAVVAVGAAQRCDNAVIARCNWRCEPGQALCVSCRLTRERPADDDEAGMAAWAHAEDAKRRLILQLDVLGLPVVGREEDPEHGLAFDLLSSRGRDVTTGHAQGVITLDLSESDDAHREFVRLQLGEPYRTVLGHLRHEIGHYYWALLVSGGPRSLPGALDLGTCRTVFGDEQVDYGDAVTRHYEQGPPDGWQQDFVSEYATMHPWEDWAETFAHHLHITDGLATAEAFGLTVSDAPWGWAVIAEMDEDDPDTARTVERVRRWLRLTFGLNAMSRSIGQDNLYPFVLTPAVLAKLVVVDRAVTGVTAR